MGWARTWRPKRTKSGFRSLGEEILYKDLQCKGIPVKYEEDTLEYTETHKYIVDFSVGDILKGGFVIEFKGYFDSADRSKMIKVRDQHPEIDIRFVFQKNNRISKSSTTTYMDWAIKHGFKAAVGFVPAEWLINYK